MARHLIQAVQEFRSVLLAGVFGASVLHGSLASLPISEPLKLGDLAHAEKVQAKQAGMIL
jgi:hypothetical protein